MRVFGPRSVTVSLGVLLLVAGCDCDGGGDSFPDAGDGARLDGSASIDASTLADASGDRRDASGSRDAAGSRRDAAGLGPEVCDGVDNDRNGIIDDVDEGGDGICDCLLIATLGSAGMWGDGDVFAAWLDARSDVGAVDLADQVLTPELLAPYQVIVAQDMYGRDYTDAEATALREWIEDGGGLMTLTGYHVDSSERTNINQLLEPSGIQYDATPILAGSPTIPVTTWHEHPVSDSVMQVGVDRGYEVVGDGEVIAEEDGLVLLRATTLGAGKVLVWGDEWITYDSEWVENPQYQLERFWLNAIKWLTPEAECQVPILI